MKDTVIITGVAGMLGSHIAERLINDWHVIGLDNLDGGRIQNVPAKVDFHEGSCLNTELVEGIFRHSSPTRVIHCAAMAAENLSHNCRAHTYRNNLVGEAVIRNAAINHDVECMVSMSSIAVMGHQLPPFTEELAPQPADPYGVSKLAGEIDAVTAQHFHKLNYVIFRPHNVIGTRQNISDRYRNVASIFCRAIVENRPLPIFGDGQQTRAFSPVSYVADIVAACLTRPETWNQVYNIGADKPMSIMDLVGIFETLLGQTLKVQVLPARQEALHAFMRHDKVRNTFPDIRERENAVDAIRTMLDEAIAQAGAQNLPPMQHGPTIEVRKNLPPSWK